MPSIIKTPVMKLTSYIDSINFNFSNNLSNINHQIKKSNPLITQPIDLPSESITGGEWWRGVIDAAIIIGAGFAAWGAGHMAGLMLANTVLAPIIQSIITNVVAPSIAGAIAAPVIAVIIEPFIEYIFGVKLPKSGPISYDKMKEVERKIIGNFGKNKININGMKKIFYNNNSNYE